MNKTIRRSFHTLILLVGKDQQSKIFFSGDSAKSWVRFSKSLKICPKILLTCVLSLSYDIDLRSVKDYFKILLIQFKKVI